MVRRRYFVAFAAVGAFAAIAAMLGASPWPPLETVRHLLAAHDCDSARAVGLAPARRGQPGYYPSHDADRDGWACEPFSPERRKLEVDWVILPIP